MSLNNTIRFFTSESLGPTQSLTPEGFLLCQNVPLARTGTLLYAAGEVPVDADADGIIRVIREPEEVFSPMAVASFAGKPVCNDHPPEKVSPDNWRTFSVGVVLNPRQGDGYTFDNQFLYADLLITDRDAIEDVREGKREVSAGYDAEYEQVRPGEGRQHLIVGNHVALVDRGRCGPRCSIGDEAMATRKRPAWFDAIMKAHRTNDEERLVDTLEKVSDMLGETWLGISGEKEKGTSTDEMGGIHVHLHQGGGDDAADPAAAGGGSPIPGKGAPPGGGDPAAAGATGGGGNSLEELAQRVAALERAVAILAEGGDAGGEEGGAPEQAQSQGNPPKDPDPTTDAKTADEDEEEKEDKKPWEDGKTTDRRAAVGDSTSLRASWQELLTRAEILCPGVKAPTFDAKAGAKTTTDSMCQFRRKVLKEALKEDDTRQMVEQLTGSSPDLTQMTCDSVQLVFNGASELVRQNNSRQTSTTGRHVYDHNLQSLTDTVKLINQRNREKYGIKA